MKIVGMKKKSRPTQAKPLTGRKVTPSNMKSTPFLLQ